ncbi:MAG: anti-sigma factor family protein [Fimbriimonas sp.]
MDFNCGEAFARLQDYLDRELTPAEILAVEAHLVECGMCAEEFRYEASILRHVRRALGDDPLPEDLAAAVAATLDRDSNDKSRSDL